MNTAKKSLKKLFSKKKKKATPLKSSEVEEQEEREQTIIGEGHSVEEMMISDDDSFDEKIQKINQLQNEGIIGGGGVVAGGGGGGDIVPSLAVMGTRRKLPSVPPPVHEVLEDIDIAVDGSDLRSPGNASSSGVYSTGRSEDVPLIKMKSYQELEREIQRRDSNLSLNEKIAMRIMAKNAVVFEEPEEIPEGISPPIDTGNEEDVEKDVDTEMENFIRPLETLIKKDHPLRKKSTPIETTDDLNEMIKDVDNFILDLSTATPDASPKGNAKTGTWVSKHANATPYSQFSETNRLQKRLQDKVTAHTQHVSKSSSPPPPLVIAEKAAKVTNLINMFESKSSSNSPTRPDIDMLPLSGPSRKVVEEVDEEEEDPIQALFLFISQLDSSSIEPMILDYLVKAVGAYAREMETVKVEVGCQSEIAQSNEVNEVAVQSEEGEKGRVDMEVQAGVESFNVECQHEYNNVEAEYQAGSLLDTMDVECQHEGLGMVDAQVQSLVEMAHSETQYEMRVFDAEVQVDQVTFVNAESQSDIASDVAVSTEKKSLMKKIGLKTLSLPILKRSNSTNVRKSESSGLSIRKSESSPLSSPSLTPSLKMPSLEIETAPSDILHESGTNTLPHVVIDASTSPISRHSPESVKVSNSVEIVVPAVDEEMTERNKTLYLETMAALVADSEKEENGTIVDVQIDSDKEGSNVGKNEPLKDGKGISMKSSFRTLSRMFSKKGKV